MGIFQQRNVPVDQTVQLNSIDVISAHVEILRGESLPDAEFTPSTDLEKRVAYTRVASGVMQGLVLSKPNPIYPETAKRNRVSGTVVIKAVIGSDGRIHQMKLVQVPDPDLAIAAVAAVRQWTYKPYTLNGVPVDVETQITVNFNIGPSSTFTLGR
jgi:TonB family protein